MFILTGGVPEQHKPNRCRKLHHELHHHGPWQHERLRQHHRHSHCSGLLASCRTLLPPDPHHGGLLPPPEPLLKPGPCRHLTMQHLFISHPAFGFRDHVTNLDGLHYSVRPCFNIYPP